LTLGILGKAPFDRYLRSDMEDVPLLIEFAPHTPLYRERELVSQLPIVRNGPAGTFVVFPHGLRMSLPTDQIVFADDVRGYARVGFGGMQFAGSEDGRLVFVRIRELFPEERLSPARSHKMLLDPQMVATIVVDGRPVWSARTTGKILKEHGIPVSASRRTVPFGPIHVTTRGAFDEPVVSPR
jgi:hypothetical protein